LEFQLPVPSGTVRGRTVGIFDPENARIADEIFFLGGIQAEIDLRIPLLPPLA